MLVHKGRIPADDRQGPRRIRGSSTGTYDFPRSTSNVLLRRGQFVAGREGGEQKKDCPVCAYGEEHLNLTNSDSDRAAPR
jgi:hypothetical protein